MVACSGANLLPDLARKSPYTFSSQPANELGAATGKRRHRHDAQRSTRAYPKVRRRVSADGLTERENTDCILQGAPIAATVLPPVQLRASRPAVAAARKSRIYTFHDTTSSARTLYPMFTDGKKKIKQAPQGRNDDFSEGQYSKNGGVAVSSNRPLRKHRRVSLETSGRMPDGIWYCPSTSLMLEEACAELSDMSRPGVWRNHAQRVSKEQEAGREQLERLKKTFKADRKRRAADASGSFVSFLRVAMSEDETERWMKRRALMKADRFTVEQKRELREWFDCLDKNGSGEIDSSELSYPLLCTGLARTALEVGHLVRQVDTDGSGEIGFNEFLAIFQKPKPKGHGKSAVDKITDLQKIKRDHGSDMQTVIAEERRSLLIKEILDEALIRNAAMEDLVERRHVAQSNSNDPALRELRDMEANLERRRVAKNDLIQAVSDATDFAEERKRLDEARRR